MSTITSLLSELLPLPMNLFRPKKPMFSNMFILLVLPLLMLMMMMIKCNEKERSHIWVNILQGDGKNIMAEKAQCTSSCTHYRFTLKSCFVYIFNMLHCVDDTQLCAQQFLAVESHPYSKWIKWINWKRWTYTHTNIY